MLESRGFATVAIGSVRPQMERTRPPRGLWTTAELGRPLGEPGDPAFQRRILLAALGLLDRADGPVILQDFHDDAPGWRDTPGWTPPPLPPPAGALVDRFAAELDALLPAWRRATIRFGRSTVGLGFLQPAAWPDLLGRFLAGELPTVTGHATPALGLRFVCDDIKALYGEAAQADGPPPASRQVDAWFWHHTAAGALLKALRLMAMQSDNIALKTVGGRFFVPAHWLGD